MKPNQRSRQLRMQRRLQRRANRKEKEGQELGKNPLQVMANAINSQGAQLAQLERNLKLSIQQLWQNDQNMKAGLDSAEFNLRSHQKVINALAQDVMNSESNVTACLETVTEEFEATSDHPAGSSRKIDWVKYHKYVEEEMIQMAEEARRADLAKRMQQMKELTEGNDTIPSKLEWFKSKILEGIEKSPEDQESRKKRAEIFFKQIDEQFALVTKGEGYNGSFIDAVIDMVAKEEKRVAEDKGDALKVDPDVSGEPAEESPLGTLEDEPEAEERVFGG